MPAGDVDYFNAGRRAVGLVSAVGVVQRMVDLDLYELPALAVRAADDLDGSVGVPADVVPDLCAHGEPSDRLVSSCRPWR